MNNGKTILSFWGPAKKIDDVEKVDPAMPNLGIPGTTNEAGKVILVTRPGHLFEGR